MPLSVALRNSVLDAILRGTAFPEPAQVWLSLHTADPGDNGASEMPNAEAYARVQIRGAAGTGDMTAAAAAASTSSVDKLFPEAGGDGWPTATHFGLWTAGPYGTGTWIGGAALTAPKTAGVGVAIRIPAGDIDVTAT